MHYTYFVNCMVIDVFWGNICLYKCSFSHRNFRTFGSPSRHVITCWRILFDS